MQKDGRFSNYDEFLVELIKLDPDATIRPLSSATHYDYVFMLSSGHAFMATDFFHPVNLEIWEVIYENAGYKQSGEKMPCTFENLKKITSSPKIKFEYMPCQWGIKITQYYDPVRHRVLVNWD